MGRKSSVATKEKEERKEWEEKIKQLMEEVKTDLEKKEVECRSLNTKLNSMEKEFNRYKTWSKDETDKYEKHIEDLENRIGEGRRNAESWKRKHDSVQSDLEHVIKDKYSLE